MIKAAREKVLEDRKYFKIKRKEFDDKRKQSASTEKLKKWHGFCKC
jgi:hypothetical protein